MDYGPELDAPAGPAVELVARGPLPGQESRYGLASAGFGVLVKARSLELDLDAAHVFKGSYVTLPADNRLLLRTLVVY